MVWGEFIHLTARPVAGTPDPHLHAHCFVFNSTRAPEEQAFKAGQFRDLKRDATYYEAGFHSRLALKLRELRLPIERTAKRWELAGVEKSPLSKFSKRTQKIEEVAQQKVIEDASKKAELGAKTRSRKQKDVTFSELQSEWRSRLTEQERDVINHWAQRIGTTPPEPEVGDRAIQAVDYAIRHLFERKSIVPERMLAAVAMRRSVGEATM